MAFTLNSTSTTAQSLTTVTDIGVVTANGALVTSGTAVNISGNGAFLLNDGLIASISFCISASANFSLMNSGLITTENTGININFASVPVTTTSITNSGEIVSTMSSAIVCAEAGLNVQNSGLISGRSTAINLSSSDLTAINRINNSGVIEVLATTTIESAINANGSTRLTNTGTIISLVNLGEGADLIDLSSTAFVPTSFVGTQSFLGGTTPSFGITKAPGQITLRADFTGDGVADFHVTIRGASTLNLSDFLL